MNLSERRVVIVGLGLMGGSLALALRPHVAYLTAVDKDQPTLDLALKNDIVDRVATGLEQTLKGGELILLAVPVRSIIDLLNDLGSIIPDGCVVLDLGSTKSHIIAAMDRLPKSFEAIGGHPLCGRETSGLTNATAHLYLDRTFVLCRNRRTTRMAESLAMSIIKAIGAEPLFMEADRHDSLLAISSHLPYIVSALLMRLAGEKAEEDSDLWLASASGFQDITRLAGTEAQLMADILLTNRTEILRALEAYQLKLADFKSLVESDDETVLIEWLNATRFNYNSYRNAKE